MKKFRIRVFAVFSALVIIAGGCALAYVMQKGSKKLPISQFYSQSHTNAIWDWSNPLNQNKSRLTDTAAILQAHQINTIYTDVSIYQSIRTIKDDAERTAQTSKLQEALQDYIATMHSHNIAVMASAGDTGWSKPAERDIPLGLLSFVESYNKNHTDKFSGMEFDIEAYNQEGFPAASNTEKSLVLMEFVDTVDALATHVESYIKGSGDKQFMLGFSIPYWFDNENGNIESFDWHDKTGPALYHIMDRLNVLPQSNVVVMAYRNAAIGNDGIIYLSRTEFEYAQNIARNVKVIVGVETTDVEPAKITFYGKTQAELSSEVALLSDSFKTTGVFGGIAINDLPGYLKLVTNK